MFGVAGVIDWYFVIAIVLLVVGFILIGIEMLAPGLSEPGIAGIACLLIGIFLISDSILQGVVITIITLVVLGIIFAIILRALSKGKLKSPIILKDEQKNKEGYVSSKNLNYLLGKKGVATTDLRPAGTGEFDDVEFDIISEGKYIVKGTKIFIYKVEGSKLIVKAED
jgi:membrane-bound ClpP family serine protease